MWKMCATQRVRAAREHGLDPRRELVVHGHEVLDEGESEQLARAFDRRVVQPVRRGGAHSGLFSHGR
jgi:predicted nucleic acid-binding protein